MDHSDQIEEEIKLIEKLLGTGRGSVDDMILDVKRSMLDPENTNTVYDSQDIRGKIGKIADNTVPEEPEIRSTVERQRGNPPGFKEA